MNDIVKMRLAFCVAIILMVCSVFVFTPVGEGMSLLCSIFATPFLFIFVFYFFKIKLRILLIIIKDFIKKFR